VASFVRHPRVSFFQHFRLVFLCWKFLQVLASVCQKALTLLMPDDFFGSSIVFFFYFFPTEFFPAFPLSPWSSPRFLSLVGTISSHLSSASFSKPPNSPRSQNSTLTLLGPPEKMGPLIFEQLLLVTFFVCNVPFFISSFPVVPTGAQRAVPPPLLSPPFATPLGLIPFPKLFKAPFLY